MKPNDIKRAYKAIKDHVRTHVTGDADDLFCACQDTFDTVKGEYDKSKGEEECADCRAEEARAVV